MVWCAIQQANKHKSFMMCSPKPIQSFSWGLSREHLYRLSMMERNGFTLDLTEQGVEPNPGPPKWSRPLRELNSPPIDYDYNKYCTSSSSSSPAGPVITEEPSSEVEEFNAEMEREALVMPTPSTSPEDYEEDERALDEDAKEPILVRNNAEIKGVPLVEEVLVKTGAVVKTLPKTPPPIALPVGEGVLCKGDELHRMWIAQHCPPYTLEMYDRARGKNKEQVFMLAQETFCSQGQHPYDMGSFENGTQFDYIQGVINARGAIIDSMRHHLEVWFFVLAGPIVALGSSVFFTGGFSSFMAVWCLGMFAKWGKVKNAACHLGGQVMMDFAVQQINSCGKVVKSVGHVMKKAQEKVEEVMESFPFDYTFLLAASGFIILTIGAIRRKLQPKTDTKDVIRYIKTVRGKDYKKETMDALIAPFKAQIRTGRSLGGIVEAVACVLMAPFIVSHGLSPILSLAGTVHHAIAYITNAISGIQVLAFMLGQSPPVEELTESVTESVKGIEMVSNREAMEARREELTAKLVSLQSQISEIHRNDIKSLSNVVDKNMAPLKMHLIDVKKQLHTLDSIRSNLASPLVEVKKEDSTWEQLVKWHKTNPKVANLAIITLIVCVSWGVWTIVQMNKPDEDDVVYVAETTDGLIYVSKNGVIKEAPKTVVVYHTETLRKLDGSEVNIQFGEYNKEKKKTAYARQSKDGRWLVYDDKGRYICDLKNWKAGRHEVLFEDHYAIEDAERDMNATTSDEIEQERIDTSSWNTGGEDWYGWNKEYQPPDSDDITQQGDEGNVSAASHPRRKLAGPAKLPSLRRETQDLKKECLHYATCPEYPKLIDSNGLCGKTCTGRQCMHWVGCHFVDDKAVKPESGKDEVVGPVVKPILKAETWPMCGKCGYKHNAKAKCICKKGASCGCSGFHEPPKPIKSVPANSKHVKFEDPDKCTSCNCYLKSNSHRLFCRQIATGEKCDKCGSSYDTYKHNICMKTKPLKKETLHGAVPCDLERQKKSCGRISFTGFRQDTGRQLTGANNFTLINGCVWTVAHLFEDLAEHGQFKPTLIFNDGSKFEMVIENASLKFATGDKDLCWFRPVTSVMVDRPSFQVGGVPVHQANVLMPVWDF